MGLKPTQTTLTVTTAGTEVQCNSNAIYASSVYFEALGSNTGYIYVGDSTVSSTNYIARLSAGQGFAMQTDVQGHVRTGGSDFKISELYVDASVSGEKVQFTYLQRTGSY